MPRPFGRKKAVDVESVEKSENSSEADEAVEAEAEAAEEVVDAVAANASSEPAPEQKEAPKKPRGTKVAVITGASTGIGLATVEAMAKSGIYRTIVMAGRDAAKHEAAIISLQRRLRSSGEDVEFRHMPLELSSLDSVREFAEEFKASELPLHTLILNAGVMMLPERKVTKDGFEYQFGVNHLAHFLLTNLLLDNMAEVGTRADPARVISLSSAAHFFPSPLLKGSVKDLQSVRYSPVGAYGQSKLANLLFAYELDRRLAAKGVPVTANAVHPGGVDTELPRYITGENSFLDSLRNLAGSDFKFPFVKTPEDGAKTSVMLATTDFGKMSGRYWQDEKPAASVSFDVTAGMLPKGQLPFTPPSITSYDPAVWQKLWEESEKLVSLAPEEVPKALSDDA